MSQVCHWKVLNFAASLGLDYPEQIVINMKDELEKAKEQILNIL